MTQPRESGINPRERRLREDVIHAEGFLAAIRSNCVRLDVSGRSCVAVPEDQLRYLADVLAGTVPTIAWREVSR